MNSAALRFAAALATALFLFRAADAGETTPPLSELRKPVEVVQEKDDDEPILPSAVLSANRIEDTARLCPADPIWYIAVPDAARLGANWDASPLGALMRETSMARMARNNRFGFEYLFSDLPATVIEAERVEAAASAFELSRVLAGMSQKMAMACYIDAEGYFSFLFLFDVGLDRVPAFEIMGDWETSFFLANPGATVTRGDHSGNHLDLWQLKKSGENSKGGAVAAGFAENFAVVSNNPQIARATLDLLGGGDSVAGSRWGSRLAASISSSSGADAVAFLRVDALLDGLKHTPIARNAVVSWANLIGAGGKDGEALYYGLQFTEDGSRETFLLPASGGVAATPLMEEMAKNLKPVSRWTTPTVLPYQPNPMFFFGAMLDGAQLGALLRRGGSSLGDSAESVAFDLTPHVRALFAGDLIRLLTGEVGVALFPVGDGGEGWVVALPCNGNPAPLLQKTESMVERNGATIYSPEIEWRGKPAWTVASADNFRRLSGHFLLAASHGDLLVSVLDQLVSGSSFSSNRDFIRAVTQAEANQGLIFYLNIPEIVVRQYPNLSHIMRGLYPRSSGLNSRPPLSVLRRYTKGLLGVVAPANGAGDFTRVTVQSPVPALGLSGAATVLRFPMSLRADGREAMAKSRDNLKEIWLRLQLYSSRFGHFPDNMEDFVAELRTTMADDEIRALMTAPAALSRMTPAEAAVNSYRYLSGVTPNDEPDIPIVYEAEPWGEDFAGMYPSEKGKAPSETGDYQKYRQLVLLNGTGVIAAEKRFQEKLLPRMMERE